VRVLAAVDKFRGSATAAEVARAVGNACWDLGWDCDEAPVADGGEGTLEALGGPNRRTTVTGPLGEPVEAAWRLSGGTAVIEMARASGLTLVGGSEGNDPVAATTAGTGQLVNAAVAAGAKRLLICLGGSATTDGGLGAIEAIVAPGRLRGLEVLVACDVRTRFTQAAALFGPQKGATPAQVQLLTGRLERLVDVYRERFGVDVSAIDGAGAAGGLAGGLVALGAHLVPGFQLVAEEIGLDERAERADLVVTGEGHLDAQSFAGKVVGGVLELATDLGKPVLAVAGIVDDDVRDRLPNVSIAERFGLERALREPLTCIADALRDVLPTVVPPP
jgi:glycerate kinase